MSVRAAGSWALQQMVRYLTELAPGPDVVLDRDRTLHVGMERAAEALEAEVAAVVVDGEVSDSVGFGVDVVPAAQLVAVARGEGSEVDVPGIGPCAAISVPVERTAQLVLARSGEPFDPEELTIVRALGRILTLSLRSVDAVAAERSLRRESEKRAREALRDPLTRLPNRALFLDRLARAVSRARRAGNSVAVLFMDMDGFKVVNDTMGHATGDDLLRAVASRLAHAVRARDTVARLGGDEFAVLMNDVDSVESTFAVAERIREALAPSIHVGGRVVNIGVSIGIAIGPRPDESPDVLLRDADLAMYRAKAEEPGGYRLFVPAMHHDLVELIELETQLRETIGQGGLA
ncbi:MAG TPA: GGDEF domain-containing protein, partial [Acidimicrobiales bacterium]|nr:GGDEF domain-containing protein [Acidimicrobiales bacterium]